MQRLRSLGAWSLRAVAAAPLALALAPTPHRLVDVPAQLAAHGSIVVIILGASVMTLRRRLGAQLAALGLAGLCACWLTPGRAAVVQDGAGERLRVVSYNMAGQTSAGDEAFYEWLRAQDADLVCLVHPPWPLPTRLAWIAERYPHRVEPAPGMSWAVVLLSRFPAEVQHVDLPGEEDRFSFAANRTLRATLPSGAEVLFSAAYHSSPRSQEQWARGVREATRDGEALRAQIEASALPCIAAGDFNSAPMGRAFASFHRESGLRSAQRLLRTGTWPSALPSWAALPIDHVWLSPEIRLVRVQAGPRFRSDHRPLVVDVALAPTLEER